MALPPTSSGTYMEALCQNPQAKQLPPSQKTEVQLAPISKPRQAQLEILTKIQEALKNNQTYKITLAKLIVHVVSKCSLDSISENSPPYELAKKWIRNASEKTYTDPTRAFGDLIDNALDASSPENEVKGFFGNGFTASMIFVSQGARMTLTTRHANECFLIEFKLVNGEIELEFKPYAKLSHGTKIEIEFNKNFDMKPFLFQCEASVRFNSGCCCQINYCGSITLLGCTIKPSNIFIEISLSHVSVEDLIGLSLENAVTKLVIPGASSHEQPAKLLNQKATCFVSTTRFAKDRRSYFILLRRNGVICEIPYKNSIDTNSSDFVVSLPHVDITTAKNEIIIGKYEQKLFFDLIDRTIQNAVSSPIILNHLYFGLQVWEAQHSSNSIKGLFSKYLKNQFKNWLKQNPDVIPINKKHHTFFASILPANAKIVPVDPILFDYNLGKLEKCLVNHFSVLQKDEAYLAKCFNGAVIVGHHVCFVDDKLLPKNSQGHPTLSKYELLNILFCPESYLKTYKSLDKLANHIIQSYPELKAHSNQTLQNVVVSKPLDVIFHQISALLKSKRVQVTTNIELEIQIKNFIYLLETAEKKLGYADKLELISFINTYYYILNNVLNFDISAEQCSYSGTKIVVTPVCITEQTEQLYLITFSSNGSLFRSFLEKTIEYWIFLSKINSGNTTSRLDDNHRLILPGYTYSPLELAVSLSLHGLDKQILNVLLEKCASISVLCLILRLLNHAMIHNVTNFRRYLGSNSNFSNLEKGISALKFCIERYFQEKVSASEIEKWLEEGYDDSGTMYFDEFNRFFSEAIENLNNFKTSSCFISDAHKALLSKFLPISQSKITKTFFTNPNIEQLLKAGELGKVIYTIFRTETESIDGVAHCISLNTVRDYFRGLITEWLQNSKDAIYSQNQPLNNQVYFRLYATKNNLCLSVLDYIGFDNLTSILDFFVKDKSQKEKSIHAVGQIGTGIFKMYEKAQQVIVTTQPLDSPYTLKISVVPIRDQENLQVVDLQIRIGYVQPEEVQISNFGTLIEVMLLPTSEEQLQSEYLHARQIITETLSSTGLDTKKIGLFFREGDEIVSKRMNPNGSTKVLYQSSSTEPVTITKRGKMNSVSYVTTQGIPLVALESFNEKYALLPPNFIRKLNQGVILDLPKVFYKPLQGRTEIIISEENLKYIQRALFIAFYMHTLDEEGYKIFNFGNDSGDIQNLYNFKIPYFREFENELDKVCKERINVNISVFMTYFRVSNYPPLPIDYAFRSYVADMIEPIMRHFNDWKSCCEADMNQIETKLNQETKPLKRNKKLEYLESIKNLINKWKTIGHLHTLVSSSIREYNKLLNPEQLVFFETYVKPWLAEKTNITDETYPIVTEESIFWRFPELRLKPLLPEFKSPHNPQSIKAAKIVKVNAAQYTSILKDGLDLVTQCLEVYCNRYLNILGIQNPYKTQIKLYIETSSSTLGSHTMKSGVISLNLGKNIVWQGVLISLKHMSEGQISKAIESMYEFFVPSRTEAGTINHELEHLICDILSQSNQSCNGTHGIVQNRDGEWVNFEASAIHSAKKAAQNNLLTLWINDCEIIFANLNKQRAQILLKKLVSAFSSPQTIDWMAQAPELNLKKS